MKKRSNNWGNFIKISGFSLLGLLFFLPSLVRAMPPGTLVYRSSGEGKIYGYGDTPLINVEKGIVKNIYSGHVGIYIGQEDGVDYIVEALSGGIVKTPADKFVNLAEGEKYLGAKIPFGLTAVQQAKVVAIANSLVGKKLAYDFDFKFQKGPGSGQWTCVGLTEKLYESANISNPNNLSALEYDSNYYAIDITSDGYDNYSVVNKDGDCFSSDFEYSKISRRSNLLIPAPELIGYDLGLENNGERFLFLPYTQFLQPTLSDVTTDIVVASSFSGADVRGRVPTAALVLRWSLINNPLSSLKIIAQKTKNIVLSVADKIFGIGENNQNTEIVLDDSLKTVSTEKVITKTGAVVNKAAKKAATSKTTQPKKVASQKKTIATSTSEKPTNVVNVTKALMPSAATKTLAKTPTKTAAATKSTNIKSTSTVAIASYYNPVVESTTPLTSSSGGSSSSNSSVPVDNFFKIATINKIYSTGDNDWIELYNTGDRDFDLATAGYRLEKAKTAEDPSLIMRLGNNEDGSYPGGTVIKAHGSYLIVKSTASNYYISRADAIATRDDFGWSKSGYTLYLGVGAISSNTDVDILEAIGFGLDATYFQGNSPAPEIKDNYILNRIKNSANNNLDFNLIKSDDPSIDWSASTTETATSTDDMATSTESSATSTDDTTTSTSENNQAKLALINKIYSTGDNDWIELFNPTQFDFDLSLAEYRLEKAKTAEDPSLIMRIGDPLDGLYPKGTIIKAQNKYLIVRDEANDFYKSRADAIATRTDFSWADSGYSLYLGTGPISSSTDSNIIDLVGYGQDATYWQGNGPAPTINDNYILSRIATSGNNNLDFNLIKSDDPNIDWSAETGNIGSSSQIYNFSSSAYDLFPLPVPRDSPGLAYLWHFDECSGLEVESNINLTTLLATDRWAAGKFGCAKETGYEYGKIEGTLDTALDMNNFSLSFWFKSDMNYPRLNLSLANSNGDSINITLEQGLMQFSGLPNPEWRYYREFAFDSIWRQATLVVNRNEGYWSLYVDGVEKFHQDSYKMFAPMDILEIGGDNGSYLIDELGIWNRALSPEEVITLRTNESPFAPLVLPEPQKLPVLRHFWNWDEGIGTSSIDLIGGVEMTISKNAWSNLDLANSALNNCCDRRVNVGFPTLNSPDLSLTFWWRSLDTYNDNRLRISLLRGTDNNIFTLISSPYSTGYNFNKISNYFSYGQDLTIPHDINWHQLSLVYDSYRHLLRFYVDGTERVNRSHIWSADRPLIDGLEIVPENGLTEIDDLGVWEGALSPKQIEEIFANN